MQISTKIAMPRKEWILHCSINFFTLIPLSALAAKVLPQMVADKKKKTMENS